MMVKQNTRITFGVGCAINRDIFYMSSTLDELEKAEDTPVSRMIFYQAQTKEKWFYHDLVGWRVQSTCFPPVAPNSIRKVYALSEQGDVECYSSKGAVIEKIPDAGLVLSNSEPNHGYVSCIQQIGTTLYVCGYGGQVYRRAASGWIHIDEQIIQKPLDIRNIKDHSQLLSALSKSAEETIGLTNINGPNERAIYVVGNGGYIAFFNGANWKVVPKVTAANLNFILPLPDGTVWVAGSKGTLLKGSVQSGFNAIARKSSSTDFYSLAMFKERLFIGAGDGIYELSENIPKRLSISDKHALDGVTSIEAKDGVLWVLASRKLARYDGVTWEIFENPHNI